MPIIPPIFVRSDDLYVFGSVEEAESFLEPVDVAVGENGYDSQGRLLQVRVRGEVKRGWFSIDQSRARVELVLVEEVPGHADELRAVLAEWLAQVESSDVPSTSPLSSLVERVRKLA